MLQLSASGLLYVFTSFSHAVQVLQVALWRYGTVSLPREIIVRTKELIPERI